MDSVTQQVVFGSSALVALNGAEKPGLTKHLLSFRYLAARLLASITTLLLCTCSEGANIVRQ